MVEKFDCIVVGAGMAGNAAAYTLAKRGLNILQLERGEYAGSKNVQGAIMYADMLEAIIPDFREDAPLERHLIEQRFLLLHRLFINGRFGQLIHQRRHSGEYSGENGQRDAMFLHCFQHRDTLNDGRTRAGACNSR